MALLRNSAASGEVINLINSRATASFFETLRTATPKWPYLISSGGNDEIGGAGDRLDHIGLLDTDLDLALGDGNRHRFTRDDFDLVFDLIVNAKFLEQPRIVGPGSGVAMADRSGIEHCPLETLRGADIRSWCALLPATPLPARANSTAGPITLPSLINWSNAAMKLTTRSPGALVLIFSSCCAMPTKSITTLLPVAFSYPAARSRTPDSAP